jgi:hypothetical protein
VYHSAVIAYRLSLQCFANRYQRYPGDVLGSHRDETKMLPCGTLCRIVSQIPTDRGQTRTRRWIFKGYKNSSRPSFGGEAKPEAPCRKNLRYVKNNFEV